MRFETHYTREEAQALLPQIRLWLKRLTHLQKELLKCDQRLASRLKPGCDLGGSLVTDWVRTLADTREVLLEFQKRDLQLKDLERGLVDFPAVIGGREVFLCWEQDEAKVEFWHDLDTGYAGREKL
jgi:hypothetical protein